MKIFIYALAVLFWVASQKLIDRFCQTYLTKRNKIINLYYDWKSIHEQSSSELRYFKDEYRQYSEKEHFLQRNVGNLIAPKLDDLSIRIEKFKLYQNAFNEKYIVVEEAYLTNDFFKLLKVCQLIERTIQINQSEISNGELIEKLKEQSGRIKDILSELDLMESGLKKFYYQLRQFQERELEILFAENYLQEKMIAKFGEKYSRAIDKRKERFSWEKPLVMSEINSLLSLGKFHSAANKLLDFVERLSLSNFLIEQLHN